MFVPDWESLMRCRLEPGVQGNFKIERFVVSEDDAHMFNLRCKLRNQLKQIIRSGEYTRLMEGGQVWMSDTPAEVRMHIPALQNASGVCLVTGLGLGCVVQGMLDKVTEGGVPVVDKVIVLEQSADILQLTGDQLSARYGDRLELREVDALTYQPPRSERYQCVWHDIWPDICADNFDEMRKLHKRYNAKSHWIGVWSKEEVIREKRRVTSWEQRNREKRSRTK